MFSGVVATGMRYITDDLIRKVGKENDLNMITSLDLTLNKGQGKKIKVYMHIVHYKKTLMESSSIWQLYLMLTV